VLESYGAGALAAPRRRVDIAGTVNLLNVGRLSPEKGQSLLLEAVAPLMEAHPGMRLRMAGVGPLEPDLRRAADRLGIARRVEFLGYVQDMSALYSDTDLVIQSSLTEGLPNVMLEAGYLRVPILATDVGGTSEVIEHGRSGWLIRPGSLNEIRDGVGRFLEQPLRFAEMADTAHADISRRFSFQERTRALMNIYEGLYVTP
jgi:glycosyltransferase involved in cell wall biosynthesis